MYTYECIYFPNEVCVIRLIHLFFKLWRAVTSLFKHVCWWIETQTRKNQGITGIKENQSWRTKTVYRETIHQTFVVSCIPFQIQFVRYWSTRNSQFRKKSEKEFNLADYEKEFGLKKKETAEVGTNTEEVVPRFVQSFNWLSHYFYKNNYSCPKKEIVLSIVHHDVLEIISEPPLVYSKQTQTDSSSSITGGNSKNTYIFMCNVIE